MRIPFCLQLGVTITLLTVGLTATSVYHFSVASRELVRKQVTGRLRDIGHTSTFMLSNGDREMIAKIRDRLNQGSRVDRAQLDGLPTGKTLHTLTSDQSRAYHEGPEIGPLIQFLRKIKLASLDKIHPLRDRYPQQFSELPDGVLAYILVEIPESPDRHVLKFLATADPDPEPPKWPGNPTGDLYVPVSSIFSDAFKGEFQVADHYYTDQFYTCLTAVVPIKDQQNRVIAVLGLDYMAGTEQDYLQKFRSLAISTILSSVVVSIVLSVLVTRYLTSLERRNRELNDYSKDLEVMVKERTIALQSANDSLQQLASMDSLTQVYNRRYFDEYLEGEWQRARRNEDWLSLILCDVDHFKDYNDTYGHQAGDVCLYNVAQAMLQVSHRSSDRVARYGGEEFVIVLPHTDREGAMRVAEAIRAQIQALNLPHMGSPTQGFVTVSMGVASMVPISEQGVFQLIQDADRGLYQAKQSGRDCVAVFREWDLSPIKS
jgi:diguanylate cyclase (GGDEF)-like protein